MLVRVEKGRTQNCSQCDLSESTMSCAAGRQHESYLSLMFGLCERWGRPILGLRESGGGRGFASRKLASWWHGHGRRHRQLLIHSGYLRMGPLGRCVTLQSIPRSRWKRTSRFVGNPTSFCSGSEPWARVDRFSGLCCGDLSF